jgi:HlyD family secretion protein
MTVVSPIDGEVTTRTAEVGKLFSAGAPLISIVDVDHAWFTFNLREDLLEGLNVGQALEVQVPALGADGALVPATITAINVEGSYANWRATKATGDFDLRTFSVRAEPVARVNGLRPGMSALVDWPATARSAK